MTPNLQIRIRKKPFAKGSMRIAFWMLDSDGNYYVAKESIREYVGNDLATHKNGAIIQNKCRQYAVEFNSRLVKVGLKKNFVDFAPVIVYNITSTTGNNRPENRKFISAEPFLPGLFIKYNVNNGIILPQDNADSSVRAVALAYTHFTFQCSLEQKLVLDVQGCGNIFTDPQICTRENPAPVEYGAGNMGESAIQLFFANHVCNQVCKVLQLDNYHPEAKVEPDSHECKGASKLCCTTCNTSFDLGNNEIPRWPYKCSKHAQ